MNRSLAVAALILFVITACAHVSTFFSGFPTEYLSFNFVLFLVVATVLACLAMFVAMAVDFLRSAAAWSRMNDQGKHEMMEAIQRGKCPRLSPFSPISRRTWIPFGVLFAYGIAAFPLTFATEGMETPAVIDGEYWLVRSSEFHNRPIKYRKITEVEYRRRKRTEYGLPMLLALGGGNRPGEFTNVINGEIDGLKLDVFDFTYEKWRDLEGMMVRFSPRKDTTA